jgi:hypothetical protein
MKWFTRKRFASYWVSTAFVETLSTVLSPQISEMMMPIFQILFGGKEKQETSTLATTVNYSDSSWAVHSILHFLVHTGYLTYYVENKKSYVSIPNKELLMHWEEQVVPLVQRRLQSGLKLNLPDDLESFNIRQIESVMKNLLTQSSFFDFPKQDENSYHMLYLGCFCTPFFGRNDVVVSSNKESGNGRYDIRIEFRNLRKAIIFEFKRANSAKSLDGDAEKALDQIITKKYYSDLTDYECLFIGAAFYKKQMSQLMFKEVRI